MNIDYLKKIAANNVDISIAPHLEESTALRIFTEFRKDLSSCGLTHFEHDKEKETYRLNNGGNMDSKDERLVKLLKGSLLQIAWGNNTPLEEGRNIVSKVAEILLNNIELIQVENFNCELYFDVDSTGNAYDRIAKLVYDDSIIGSFYKEMNDCTKDFRIGENDLHFLFYIGESQTGAFKIRGKTTKREIFTSNYDDDPLKIFFGIQESRLPDSNEEFFSSLLAHIDHVYEVARSVFVPLIVDKCSIQQKTGTDKD